MASENKRDPITIVLLNLVKPTNGISSSHEKKGLSFSMLRNHQPIVSNRLSSVGASSENRKVNKMKDPLLILTNRKNTVRMYHNAFVFGIKPRIIPRHTACAIAPGCTLLFKALKKRINALSIGTPVVSRHCEPMGRSNLRFHFRIILLFYSNKEQNAIK